MLENKVDCLVMLRHRGQIVGRGLRGFQAHLEAAEALEVEPRLVRNFLRGGQVVPKPETIPNQGLRDLINTANLSELVLGCIEADR